MLNLMYKFLSGIFCIYHVIHSDRFEKIKIWNCLLLTDVLYPHQALMALFVLASKDGWVQLMYTGLDAVAIDQQVLSSSGRPQH